MQVDQNKDKLSCRILLLQRKPKLGRTKPLTGPHAPRGLDVASVKKYLNATAIYLHQHIYCMGMHVLILRQVEGSLLLWISRTHCMQVLVNRSVKIIARSFQQA